MENNSAVMKKFGWLQQLAVFFTSQTTNLDYTINTVIQPTQNSGLPDFQPLNLALKISLLEVRKHLHRHSFLMPRTK